MQSIATPHLHPSWKIYATAPAQVRHILSKCQNDMGEGAFSVVIVVDELTVLKLSTCEASQVILPKLMNNPTPGLPLVYKAFGQVGEVEGVNGFYETLPVHAYLVERLWCADDFGTKKLRTDHCPRGDMMRARTTSDAIGAYKWLATKLCGSPAWHYERCGRPTAPNAPHPLVGIVHGILGHTRFKPLVNVVKKMSHRVLAEEWTFDFINRFHYNVMLSSWGEPILADPVYNRIQPIWKQPYQDFDNYSRYAAQDSNYADASDHNLFAS